MTREEKRKLHEKLTLKEKYERNAWKPFKARKMDAEEAFKCSTCSTSLMTDLYEDFEDDDIWGHCPKCYEYLHYDRFNFKVKKVKV